MNGRDVYEFASKGSFNEEPINGKIIETHISWVVLSRKYAFKIKKPLKLDFLDFSTLALRKYYCGRELELNSRFSDIYLDVLPIRGRSSKWTAGGDEGKIIDYAVLIKRLDSSKQMNVLLKDGNIKPGDIKQLAYVISGFHRSAKKIFTDFNIGEAQKLFNDIANIKLLKTLKGGSSLIKTAIQWSNEFIKKHKVRFNERINEGLKRDVHGDLHSGNIFLYDLPILFDCIEFNDRYRQIDILYEIAFLCMDLDSFGQKDLAKVFIEEYEKQDQLFEIAEDKEIFNYYKCVRANIRAKVNAISAYQSHNEESRNRYLFEMQKYVNMMMEYINAASLK